MSTGRGDEVEFDLYGLYQEGRARLARGDTAQALVPLERACRMAPDQASIREALGQAYLRLRRFREAEAEFEAMVELAPNDHYAYYGLGRAREALGQRTLARGHYRIATLLRPSNADYERALRRLAPSS
jgi:Flp pilus assembly protein TadD